MEFYKDWDGQLYRKDGNDYASFKDEEWCTDGYAYGAFKGFESGSYVDEKQAVKCLIDDYGIDKSKAKELLVKKQLDRDESIAYMAKHRGYSQKEAAKALGF